MIYHNENENDSEKLIKLFSLVSGNAGDKKNLHSSGRNFFFCLLFFFDRFSRDILFSSLVSFVFFDSCFFVVYLFLFEHKNVYCDTHSSLQVSER